MPRVGAGVLHDAEAVGLDVAVAAPADRELEDGRPAVLHRDHVLAAALRPADRTPGRAGEPGDEDRLDAEAPSRRTRRRRPERRRARRRRSRPRKSARHVAVEVWGLRREPQGRPPVVADVATQPRGLERARRHPLAHQAARHDNVAAVEQRLVALRPDGSRRRSCPVSGKRSTSPARAALGVDDDRQRVVVDDHELGGVDAVGAALGEDDGDDVADEADDLAREERAAPSAGRDPGSAAAGSAPRRDVRGREDLRPGHGRDRRGVDADDARVRVRRADERRVERARERRSFST